jgi:hypothetical protein
MINQHVWTSGSSLGVQSAPRWCSTGEAINTSLFKWNAALGPVPSTDVNKYLLAVYIGYTPAESYMANLINTTAYSFPLCEEYK